MVELRDVVKVVKEMSGVQRTTRRKMFRYCNENAVAIRSMNEAQLRTSLRQFVGNEGVFGGGKFESRPIEARRGGKI